MRTFFSFDGNRSRETHYKGVVTVLSVYIHGNDFQANEAFSSFDQQSVQIDKKIQES